MPENNRIFRLRYSVEWKCPEMDRFFMVSKDAFKNLKVLFEKFIPIISTSVKEQFAKEGDPEKWKSLTKNYLNSPKKRNSKYPLAILKLTGRMYESATKKGAYGNVCDVSNDGLMWGINLSKIPYARLHDKGGTVQGRKYPKREFMLLTRLYVNKIVQEARKFVYDLTKGKRG